jgi:competence protein ComEA
MTFNKPVKKNLLTIIAIIAVAVFGIIFKILSSPQEIIIDETGAAATEISENSETVFEEYEIILAYITGEVNNPGVYELKNGDRVKDIVDMAGGFTDEADTVNINLAQKIRDEDRVYIPKLGESPPEFETNKKPALIDINLIDINSATVSELSALPGIGNVKGQNIVNHRESFGKFKSIEELKNVSGIGEKTFEGLKDLVTAD